jgi:hypothetical protein
MFAAVVRDAWRQYRRRPLAAVISVAVGGLPVFLEPDEPAVAVPLAVVLLAAGLLVELFLVAWMGGAVGPAPTSAAAALATLRRTIGPGIRAGLLRAAYLLAALTVGLVLFGSREGGTLSHTDQTKLAVGLWPLFGVAFAFLAVLMQRVVLGGERQAPFEVASRDGLALAGRLETLGGVLADGVEQAETPALGDDERLLDEPREQIDDPPLGYRTARADLLGRLEREAAEEDREAAVEDALLAGEELVAPVDRGP